MQRFVRAQPYCDLEIVLRTLAVDSEVLVIRRASAIMELNLENLGVPKTGM
jgi:hypothetical protein